jgi:hypothetical protein
MCEIRLKRGSFRSHCIPSYAGYAAVLKCGYIAQITLNRISRNTICARLVEASSVIYCYAQSVLRIYANFLVVLAATVVLLCRW